jgi:hypothetical protein
MRSSRELLRPTSLLLSFAVQQPASDIIFNVPNVLTAARLALSVGVFVLIPLEQYFGGDGRVCAGSGDGLGRWVVGPQVPGARGSRV